MRFQVSSLWHGIANGETWCHDSELHGVLMKETKAGNTCVVRDHTTGGMFECLDSTDVEQCLNEIERFEEQQILQMQDRKAEIERMLTSVNVRPGVVR